MRKTQGSPPPAHQLTGQGCSQQPRMAQSAPRWPPWHPGSDDHSFQTLTPRSSIEWSTFDPQVFPDTSNTTAALRSMSRRRLEYLRETRLVYLKKKITLMLRQTLLKVEVDEQRRNCKTYSFRAPFSQAFVPFVVFCLLVKIMKTCQNCASLSKWRKEYFCKMFGCYQILQFQRCLEILWQSWPTSE